MSRANINQSVFQQSIARFKFKNTSGEDVPPYAAMIVDTITRQEDRKLQATIRKCTEQDEEKQNHAMVMFNLDRKVGGDKIGYGTFSLPCIGRVEGNPSPLAVAGPVADSWYLWVGGLTHTVRFVESIGGSDYCMLLAHTSPGAEGVMVEGDPGQWNGIIELDQTSVTDSDRPVKIRAASRASIAYEDNKYLQAKLVSGQWRVDVEYCKKN